MAATLASTKDRHGQAADLLYAGFWRRMAADLVDNIMLLPILSALAPTRWPAHPTLVALAQAMAADPFRQFLGLIFSVAYSVVFWVKFLGTPGKLLLSCHLVDAHTLGPLSVGQSLLRNLGYLVSYATLGLGFLWIAWDPRKQGFHDKIAGSVVLHVPRRARRG
ncbi:RDD family protein [Acidiferrobacter sp.]|uniref:RDD family protein n=1 Tax=Acidiferrobacter sp. TaxID=1872107 RepID=UPI0026295577|nr:RDD family protein [Acidiferrobacter sp.]